MRTGGVPLIWQLFGKTYPDGKAQVADALTKLLGDGGLLRAVCRQAYAICRPQPRSHCIEWVFPEDELVAGPGLELRNMLNYDALELVDELPPSKYVYDMVWVDEWRGDRVRSRICVRQFKAEGLRDDLFAGTPDTFFIKYLLTKAASCKDFGLLVVDISVSFMHARTDEDICLLVPLGIKSSRLWQFKAAVHGTRNASKHWQEFSRDKLVTNMLFQQNDIDPCIYKRFCDIWT